MFFDTVLAISSFLQPPLPSEPVNPMLDKSVLNKIVEGQKYFFAGSNRRINKFNMGNNRIAPSLVADGAQFEIEFLIVEKEIPLPNDGACRYYFEYPQISGLADKARQNQINQVLKDKLIGDEESPKLFAYQEECMQGRTHKLPNGQRTVKWLAFDVRMSCDLEFASGSIISVYCRHSVLPGAYPHMTYYPITFDVRTGKKLNLHELFMSNSDIAEAIAEERLKFWFQAVESGAWVPREGHVQEVLERLAEKYESNFYDFYLESDCLFTISHKEKITEKREFCLSFPHIRFNHIAEGIQYNESIDLEELASLLEPSVLLEEAVNLN